MSSEYDDLTKIKDYEAKELKESKKSKETKIKDYEGKETKIKDYEEKETKIKKKYVPKLETADENGYLLELINNYIFQYTSLSYKDQDQDFIESRKQVNELKDEIQQGLYNRNTLKNSLTKLKNIKDKFIPKASNDSNIERLINIGSLIEIELNNIFDTKHLTFDGRRSKKRSIKRKTRSKKISKKRSIKRKTRR